MNILKFGRCILLFSLCMTATALTQPAPEVTNVWVDSGRILDGIEKDDKGALNLHWYKEISSGLTPGAAIDMRAFDGSSLTATLLPIKNIYSVEPGDLRKISHALFQRDSKGGVSLRKGGKVIKESEVVPASFLSNFETVKKSAFVSSSACLNYYIFCSPILKWTSADTGEELATSEGRIPNLSYYLSGDESFPLRIERSKAYPPVIGKVYWTFLPSQLDRGLGEKNNDSRRDVFKEQLGKMWATYLASCGFELVHFDDQLSSELPIGSGTGRSKWDIQKINEAQDLPTLVKAWELKFQAKPLIAIDPVTPPVKIRSITEISVRWDSPCMIELGCKVKSLDGEKYVNCQSPNASALGVRFSLDKDSPTSLTQVVKFNPPVDRDKIEIYAFHYAGENLFFPPKLDVVVKYDTADEEVLHSIPLDSSSPGGWPAYQDAPAATEWSRSPQGVLEIYPTVKPLAGRNVEAPDTPNMDFLINLPDGIAADMAEKLAIDQLTLQLGQLAGIAMPTVHDIPDFDQRLAARLKCVAPLIGRAVDAAFRYEPVSTGNSAIGRFRPTPDTNLSGLRRGLDAIHVHQVLEPGKSADFSFFRLSNSNFWAKTSATMVDDGSPKGRAVEAVFADKFSNPRLTSELARLDAIICVGMASQRGDRDYNEELAQRRAATLVSLCDSFKKKKSQTFDIYGLYMGKYIGGEGDRPSQRAILLVGVNYDKLKISSHEMKEAFRRSLHEVGEKGSIWQDFEREYSNFKWGMEEQDR